MRLLSGAARAPSLDGPWVTWTADDRFNIIPLYRTEDGSPAIRADQAPAPQKEFHLEFIFPNLWQNYLSEKLRAMLAFVPVDDENTVIYLRQYQKFVRTPGVRTVVNKLSMPFNKLILQQDTPRGADRAAEGHQLAHGRKADPRRRADHRVPAPPAAADRRGELLGQPFGAPKSPHGFLLFGAFFALGGSVAA